MTSPSVGRVSVKVIPEIASDARQKITRQLQRLEATVKVGTRLDTSGLRNQLRAVSETTNGVVARVPVEFVPQLAILRSRLEALVRAAAAGVSAEVDVDLNTSALDRLKKSLSSGSGGGGPGLAKTLGLITKSMLGLGAASGAVQTIAGLAGALAQLAPAALAVPGILLGIGAAALTAKLGMQGFLDAVKTGDLSKLAPSAREAATALRSFSDEWKSIQQGTQQNLFRGLAADIKLAATANLPVLKTGLQDIASQLNVVASGALKAMQSPFFQDDLSQILGNTAGMFREIGSGVGDLISGIVGLGGVGSTYLPALGTAIGNVANRFKQWVDSGGEDGSIKRMIDSAIAGFKDLGAIVGNVASIIGSVFSGLSAGSGATSFLSSIRDITAALKTFAASTEAQTFLQQLGATMAVAGTAVKDLLLAALQSLMPVVSAVLPLFNSLGLAFSQVAQSGALQALGEAVAQVVQAFVNGLVPIIPLVAGLFTQLVQAVAPVVAALAPVVSQLLAGLLPALQQLLPVIGQAAVTIGTALAEAIKKIVDSGAIERLATAFTSVITAVVPLIPQIAQLVADVLPVLADVFIDVVVPAIELAADIIRNVIVPALQYLIDFVRMVVDDVKRRWSEITSATQQLGSDVDTALQFFRDLPQKFAEWMTSVGTAVNNGISDVVGFFRELPGKITGAIGDLGGLLVSAGKSLMDGLGKGIKDGLQAVLDFASGIAAKIAAVKGPIPKDRRELIPAGLALMAGLHKGLRKGFSPVLKTAVGMAGQLADAFEWTERSFPNLGKTSVSGSIVSTQYADLNQVVSADGFGSIADRVSEGIDRGLANWTVQIDHNGIAKLVNKANNTRKRR